MWNLREIKWLCDVFKGHMVQIELKTNFLWRKWASAYLDRKVTQKLFYLAHMRHKDKKKSNHLLLKTWTVKETEQIPNLCCCYVTEVDKTWYDKLFHKEELTLWLSYTYLHISGQVFNSKTCDDFSSAHPNITPQLVRVPVSFSSSAVTDP